MVTWWSIKKAEEWQQQTLHGSSESEGGAMRNSDDDPKVSGCFQNAFVVTQHRWHQVASEHFG